MKQFFGKYRGKVTKNVDLKRMGRVQVSVPTVLGQGANSWAMPNAPYAGPGVGFFAIPPVGASVWVEFEGGDPDYPIWAGCFWGAGEAPEQPTTDVKKIFKTEEITIEITDAPGAGSIVIKTKTGKKIEIKPDQIVIDNGQNAIIKLKGPTVSVNGTALEVT